MKKIHSNIIFTTTILFLLALLGSCKKSEYISGGTVLNPKVNMTTYDYLKTNPLFDTLMLIVDKAGMKDVINQTGTTFFAPTDYGIYAYLNSRTLAAQARNQYAQYTLDSLYKYDLQRVKDSLKMYIINQPLTFDRLTNDGNIYTTSLAGDTAVVSYEYTKDGNLGYSSLVSSQPQLTYFTQLWYHLATPFSAINILPTIGVHTLCQTSGIQTTNGVLNVLSNAHVLFFYGTKK